MKFLHTSQCKRTLTCTQNIVWDRSVQSGTHLVALLHLSCSVFWFCFVFFVLSVYFVSSHLWLASSCDFRPFPNVFHLHLIALFLLCSPHWSTCPSPSRCQKRLWEPGPLAARRFPLNVDKRCLIRHLWPNLLTRIRPCFPLPLNLFVLPC